MKNFTLINIKLLLKNNYDDICSSLQLLLFSLTNKKTMYLDFSPRFLCAMPIAVSMTMVNFAKGGPDMVMSPELLQAIIKSVVLWVKEGLTVQQIEVKLAEQFIAISSQNLVNIMQDVLVNTSQYPFIELTEELRGEILSWCVISASSFVTEVVSYMDPDLMFWIIGGGCLIVLSIWSFIKIYKYYHSLSSITFSDTVSSSPDEFHSYYELFNIYTLFLKFLPILIFLISYYSYTFYFYNYKRNFK